MVQINTVARGHRSSGGWLDNFLEQEKTERNVSNSRHKNMNRGEDCHYICTPSVHFYKSFQTTQMGYFAHGLKYLQGLIKVNRESSRLHDKTYSCPQQLNRK